MKIKTVFKDYPYRQFLVASIITVFGILIVLGVNDSLSMINFIVAGVGGLSMLLFSTMVLSIWINVGRK